MKVGLVVLAAAGAVVLTALVVARPQLRSPLALKVPIEKAHPGVPWVSTASVAELLAMDPGKVVLLDVRQADEYGVSHLPGAMRVDPSLEDVTALGLGPDRPVVVYCSVGYRSAALGRRLRSSGIPARNLLGGIFQWANEGRPLVSDQGAVQTVHPYDAVWGLFLRPKLRAEAPGAASAP